MKHFFLYIFFIPVLVHAKQSDAKTIKAQLTEINVFWKDKEINNSLLQHHIPLQNEIEKMKLHLSLVEATLRNTPSQNLTNEQLKNRNHCLDILHQYWSKGVFPKNTFHQIRIPYFIDIYGTYCAVGYLIKETGYDVVAQKIHEENNFGYLKDLNKQYDEIGVWASEYGFSIDELAWIQPTYGPPNNYPCFSPTFTTQYQVINASCPGNCDGAIILPSHHAANMQPIVSGYINGAAGGCNTLCQGTYTVMVTDALGYMSTTVATIGVDNQLSATVTKTNASCFGKCDATITFNNVSGGVPPYAYSLNNPNVNIVNQNSNVFDSLCYGYYTAHITDVNGCLSNTFGIQVTQPPNLNIAISMLTPILCNADTAVFNVTATGGVSPYLGTGIQNMVSGIYTISISDANNCTKTSVLNITEPPSLLLYDSIITPVLCYGDSATISIAASGGTSPYMGIGTYSFIAGVNQITITDSNGCILDTSIYITQPPQLLVSDAIITPVLCYGDSATVLISASGGVAPYNNTGNFIKAAGMFTYTVTDSNNCIIIDSIFINSPSLLTASLSSTQDNGTGNGTATANPAGGTAPYTYLWSNGGNADIINGLPYGWYYVTITDTNLCTYDDSVYVSVKTPEGISTVANSFIRVYPNPSDGVFQLVLDKKYQNVTLELSDVTGRLIFSKKLQ